MLLTQDGKLASSYASHPGFRLLEKERSACYHEFDVFQLDHYISLKNAITDGNDARVRELVESMEGLPLGGLDVCPLLSDDSKLQVIPRYRPLLLICIDHNREDIACWLLQQGCNYAINDNLVITHWRTITLGLYIVYFVLNAAKHNRNTQLHTQTHIQYTNIKTYNLHKELKPY